MSTDSQVIDVADGRKKLYGILLICAINLSHKSVFKQIIKLVEEIQTSKASIQVLADKTFMKGGESSECAIPDYNFSVQENVIEFLIDKNIISNDNVFLNDKIYSILIGN
ncbi:unnamed protein product [Rotaria sordida]|uniref:Uncharacterized protein n=1 Tax=Rotaria sordida TaxID=392033 RepID=A0A815P660_9BILA|nr:unnamed protein product [Rotaria sordida]CAF1444674.1 unnamed protein product [Rotaria sordida]